MKTDELRERSHPNPHPRTYTGPVPWEEVQDGYRRGYYQFWALITPNHPLGARGMPRQIVRSNGVRTPLLRVVQHPPKRLVLGPWRWVRLDPGTFHLLLRQHGPVMRGHVGRTPIRLFNDPRLSRYANAHRPIGV